MQRHRDAGAVDLAAERRQVGAHQRQQRCVERRRRRSHVLAELGHHLAGERQVDAGQLLRKQLADAQLVGRIEEREQQHHGDRLHVRVADGGRRCAHRLLVERLDLGALRVQPAAHLEAQLARHDRLWLRRPQVVHRCPHLGADGQHVTEAAVGDQRRPRQPPLDDRVGGNGRAMCEVSDVARLRAAALQQLRQRVHEPALDPLRRRGHLGDLDPAVRADDHGVGEGAADVDADPAGLVLAHAGMLRTR